MRFIHKHSFLLRDVVLSGLLAFGIIALLVLAVGSMAVNYDRPDLVSPAFSNNYNKLNSLDIFGTMSASVISDYTFLDAGVIKILMGVLLAGLLTSIIFIWISSVTRGRI